MIQNARIVVGLALCSVASVVAGAGRACLGRPTTRLTADHATGATRLAVDQRLPRGAPALKLESAAGLEVVRIVKVDGLSVVIDRPLAAGYPAGSIVRVLV